MRVRKATALLVMGLGLGGVGGFVGGLVQDLARRKAGPGEGTLWWDEDAAGPRSAESRGVVHGTQTRTAHSRLAL
jgi:hypothetical protein